MKHPQRSTLHPEVPNMEGDNQAPDYFAAPPGLARGPHPSEINAVPKYQGDSNNDEYDARQWLDILEEHAQMWGWSEETCIRVARIRMAGPARHWISSLNRNTPWRELVEKFLARFGERKEAALSRLAACKQETGENVDSYADRFRRDCNLAGRAEDAALRHQFIAGLHRRLKLEVHRQMHNLHSLSEIITTAKEWEVFYEDDRRNNNDSNRNQPYVPPPRRDEGDYNRRNNQGPRQNGFDQGYGRGPRGPSYTSAPPRPGGYQNDRPAYPGPREPDNRNRNYQGPPRPPMNNRPYSAPPPPRAAPAVPAAAPAGDVDDLARQLERLQLNVAQMRREQRQDGGTYHMDAINMFDPSSSAPAAGSQPTVDSLEEIRRELNILASEVEKRRKGQYQPFQLTKMIKSKPASGGMPSVPEAAIGDDQSNGSQQRDSQGKIPIPWKPIPAPSQTWSKFPARNKPLTGGSEKQLVMDFVEDEEDPSAYWGPEDLYASKRPGEELEPARRAPNKRVAFDVGQGAAHAAAAPRPGSPYPGRAPPAQRVPFAEPRASGGAPAARQNGPQASGPRTPEALRPPPPQRSSYNSDPTHRADPLPLLNADALAESKGREMALKACRSLSVDALREASLVIPAAKMCAAGVLLNDPQLVEKGKDTARRSDNFLKRLQTQNSAGGSAAAPQAANLYQPYSIAEQVFHEETVATDRGRAERDMAPKAVRLSTCKVPVRLGSPDLGAVFEATAILDTGASQSAVTIDVLRRMGLMKCIDKSRKSIYYNADGRKSTSLGHLISFPVTIGHLTTKVNFSVTDAMSYDVLLGMDFLVAIGAIINLRSSEVHYDLGDDLDGKKELLIYQSQHDESTICVNAMETVNESFWATYAWEEKEINSIYVADYLYDTPEPHEYQPVRMPEWVHYNRQRDRYPGPQDYPGLITQHKGERTKIVNLHEIQSFDPVVDGQGDLYGQNTTSGYNVPAYMTDEWLDWMADHLCGIAASIAWRDLPPPWLSDAHCRQWLTLLTCIRNFGYNRFDQPEWSEAVGRWTGLQPAEVAEAVRAWGEASLRRVVQLVEKAQRHESKARVQEQFAAKYLVDWNKLPAPPSDEGSDPQHDECYHNGHSSQDSPTRLEAAGWCLDYNGQVLDWAEHIQNTQLWKAIDERCWDEPCWDERRNCQSIPLEKGADLPLWLLDLHHANNKPSRTYEVLTLLGKQPAREESKQSSRAVWVLALRAIHLHGYPKLVADPGILDSMAKSLGIEAKQLENTVLRWKKVAARAAAKAAFGSCMHFREKWVREAAECHLADWEDVQQEYAKEAWAYMFKRGDITEEAYCTGVPAGFTGVPFDPTRTQLPHGRNRWALPPNIGSHSREGLLVEDEFGTAEAQGESQPEQAGHLSDSKSPDPTETVNDPEELVFFMDEDLQEQEPISDVSLDAVGRLALIKDQPPLKIQGRESERGMLRTPTAHLPRLFSPEWCCRVASDLVPWAKQLHIRDIAANITDPHDQQWVGLMRCLHWFGQQSIQEHFELRCEIASWIDIHPTIVTVALQVWQGLALGAILASLSEHPVEDRTPFMINLQSQKYLIPTPLIHEALANWGVPWNDSCSMSHTQSCSEAALYPDYQTPRAWEGASLLPSWDPAQPIEMINVMESVGTELSDAELELSEGNPSYSTNDDVWDWDYKALADDLAADLFVDRQDDLLPPANTTAEENEWARVVTHLQSLEIPEVPGRRLTGMFTISVANHFPEFSEPWVAYLAVYIIPFAKGASGLTTIAQRAEDWETYKWMVIWKALHLFGEGQLKRLPALATEIARLTAMSPQDLMSHVDRWSQVVTSQLVDQLSRRTLEGRSWVEIFKLAAQHVVEPESIFSGLEEKKVPTHYGDTPPPEYKKAADSTRVDQDTHDQMMSQVPLLKRSYSQEEQAWPEVDGQDQADPVVAFIDSLPTLEPELDRWYFNQLVEQMPKVDPALKPFQWAEAVAATVCKVGANLDCKIEQCCQDLTACQWAAILRSIAVLGYDGLSQHDEWVQAIARWTQLDENEVCNRIALWRRLSHKLAAHRVALLPIDERTPAEVLEHTRNCLADLKDVCRRLTAKKIPRSKVCLFMHREKEVPWLLDDNIQWLIRMPEGEVSSYTSDELGSVLWKMPSIFRSRGPEQVETLGADTPTLEWLMVLQLLYRFGAKAIRTRPLWTGQVYNWEDLYTLRLLGFKKDVRSMVEAWLKAALPVVAAKVRALESKGDPDCEAAAICAKYYLKYEDLQLYLENQAENAGEPPGVHYLETLPDLEELSSEEEEENNDWIEEWEKACCVPQAEERLESPQREHTAEGIFTLQAEPPEDDVIDVGYPLYNSGEMPPMAQASPMLTPDDITVGSTLTPEQQGQLRAVLWRHREAFAFTPEQFGRSNIVTFSITLKEGAQPVAQAYHRTPFKHRDALKAEIDKMLELGLIKPSCSPWASPVVLVPKKDGTLRMCLDYRKLNAMTVKDEGPIPVLDEVLALLGEAKYYCSVDATKGFLQLECDPETSKMCAFITPFGLFEPTVMCMGLKNAPPVWQRAMSIGLSKHIGRELFVYMDDAIIIAPTFEQLLVNVSSVLQSFQDMNIKLSPTKSQFGVTNLKFLGHHISPDGIKPDPDMIQAIARYPEPREKVHVQRFLGLTNWLRKYVKDYAKVAAPLTDLTGNAPFYFGAEAKAAMAQLQERLLTAPILRHPDLKRPFILKTDACQTGYGGILCQKDDQGREYVIRYGSKRTTRPERNYSASELECAAVMHFVKKWSVYLLGGKFTLVTDHQALKYLMTTKDLTGKLARWAIRLQEYDFDIEYRKGKEHGDVDALSRAVGQNEEEESPTATCNLLTDQPSSRVVRLANPADTYAARHRGTARPAVLTWEEAQDEGTFSCREPEAQYVMHHEQPTSAATLTGSPPLSVSTAPASTTLLCSEEVSATEAEEDSKIIASPDGQQKLRIAVEGSIGSGKSALLAELSLMLPAEWHLLPEPVEEWNRNGELTNFYQREALPRVSLDRWKAAFSLQQNIVQSYLNRAPLPNRVVMERGTWSALTVFTPLAKLHPTMEDKLYQLAQRDSRLSDLMPDVIIYVDTPAEVCMERIRNRGLDYEASISWSYLKDLELAYQQALESYPGMVYRVDGTLPRHVLALNVANIISHINSIWESTAEHPPIPIQPRAVPKATLAQDLELEGLHEKLSDLCRTVELPARQSNPAQVPPGGTVMAALAYATAEVPFRLSGSWAFNLDTEALVLYQEGEGMLQFTPEFVKEFTSQYGLPPCLHDRVDNFPVIKTMAKLGFKQSVASGCEPALAIVPRRALPGLKIRQLKGGKEWVEISPELYALQKIKVCPKSLFDLHPHNIIDGYRLEGQALANDVRVFRGEGPELVFLQTGLDHPKHAPAINLYSEFEDDDSPSEGKNPAKEESEEITRENSEDSGPSIPVDLCCEVCGSPEKWDSMLLCSECTKGFHLDCIGLGRVPKGPWFCSDCLIELQQPSPTTPAAGGKGDTRDTSSEEPSALDLDIEGLAEEAEPQEEQDIHTDENTLAYLRHGRLPRDRTAGWSSQDIKQEMKRVTKRAASYEYKGNTLYKKASGAYPARVVPKPEERAKIIKDIHQNMGHLGINKVASLVSKRFYFRGMREAVAAEVKSCHACALKKADFKEDPELHPLPPMPCFHRFCMDTVGPFPLTARGNQHVLVCIDHWSKWPEAVAIPDKKSVTVARATDDIICRYLPKEIQSDQGPEFRGAFPHMLQRYGIRHVKTTPYRPTSNGLAERTVQSILHSLQAIAVQHPESWDDHLPEILMGLRAAKQETVGYSPYFMVFGKEAHIPAQRHHQGKELRESTPELQAAEVPQHQLRAQLEERANLMNEAAKKVLGYVEVAQEKQKAAYRRRRNLAAPQTVEQRMPPGSMILLQTAPRSRKKLNAAAEGPYKIFKYGVDRTSVALEDAAGKKWWVSSHRIAPYIPLQQQPVPSSNEAAGRGKRRRL